LPLAISIGDVKKNHNAISQIKARLQFTRRVQFHRKITHDADVIFSAKWQSQNIGIWWRYLQLSLRIEVMEHIPTIVVTVNYRDPRPAGAFIYNFLSGAATPKFLGRDFVNHG